MRFFDDLREGYKAQNPVNQMIYRVLILFGIAFCRDGRIRTCGLHIPNVARYRATLHPVPDWVCKSRILNQVTKLFLKEFIAYILTNSFAKT
jgi:hypothetical protein